ncbi:MAG: hypothetical protein WC450_03735, partial [Candidatus Omnitrophota bacterium]
MKRRLWIIVFWAFLAVTAGGGVAADELLDSAGAFFKSYVDGGNRADLYIIDYFADDARIVAVRHLREGGTAKIGTTGEKHKKFLMKMRRHARAIKTTTQTLTTFSDVAYNLENGCVRITALRHVTPKETTTPYSLLICKNDSN